MMRRRLLASALLLLVCLWSGRFEAADEPLPIATPASKGFSPERLARVRSFLEKDVDSGNRAGVIWLFARHGHIVDWQSYGKRDLEQQLPMEKDTIVRLYSMSKVITSVAAMILVEEGRLRLDDRVDKFLPALEAMKVMTGGTAERPLVAPAKTPITVRHLLTHTAGFIYAMEPTPLARMYAKADLWDVPSLDAFIARVAKLPLAHEPGKKFTYGVNTDVLGAVIEVVSGQKFDAFVDERICHPLGMADTGFDVPESKRARMAKVYGREKETKRLGEQSPVASAYAEAGKGFAAGGSGMFSTARDYARFGQMLLNGGELNGVRILGRKTVELMMANHLAGLEQPTMRAGEANGFGLGGSVRIDIGRGSLPGSVGQFGWSGAATTSFNIDPREGTMVLLLAQHFPYNEGDLIGRVSTLFYQALED